ncbi:MAG: zinc-binding alcohol dehydrogenase family protein [Kordiimonadaceae bacterium]|nr:zinc-binding alcohol dehydrogenase family protein [Kordiimonadaceae bacterium]
MRVFGFDQARSADNAGAIIEAEWQTPTPTGHDILVAVKAVSINPVDTKIRQAKADDGTFTVAGWDAVGTVIAVGDKASMFQKGDDVWYAGAISRPGSNAEFQLVDERIVAVKPKSFDNAAAAAMPLTILTAWEALHQRMNISRESAENEGRKLLIINGAGGVGSVAIQLAKLVGLHVTATASRDESRDWCLGFGADTVVPHAELTALPDSAFDWIFCCHDTDPYFDEAARLIKPFGMICMLVNAQRDHNIQALKQKSAGLVWEFMFAHSNVGTDAQLSQHKILTEAARLVDKGALKSTLTKTLSPMTADNIRMGHQLIETGGMIGKLVIST